MGRIRTGLAACLAWGFLLAATAQAGDYVVNATDDDAATEGTLRKEILDLNADAEAANTITFSVPDGSNIDISTNGNLDAIEQSITSFTSTGGDVTLTNSGSSTSYGLRFSGSGDLLGGISDDFTINVDTTTDSAYGIYGSDALTIGDLGAKITVDAVNSGASGIRTSWDTLTLGAVSSDISVYSDVNHVYGIYGGGDGIVMNGDFTGMVSAESGGNYVGAVNAEDGDLVVNGSLGGTIRAKASGDQVYGIYAYVDDILISGDLSADVTAIAGAEDARAVYAEGDDGDADIWIGGDMSGNITATAGADQAYGFYVNDNAITIDGSVTGDITATAGNGGAFGMYSGGDINVGEDYNGNVTVSAGSENAYGLYASNDISIGGALSGDFTVTGGSDNSSAVYARGDITISGGISGKLSATASGDDASGLNAYGGSLTITIEKGITGDILATASRDAYGISMAGINPTLSVAGGILGDITANASDRDAYGIYVYKGNTTINDGIDGDITAVAGTSYNAYGIYSPLGQITLNGGIQGDITATAGEYSAYGISADSITITGGITGDTNVQAGDYDAMGFYGATTLGVTGDITGNISATAGDNNAYGLYGDNSLTLDGDMTGDIAVNAVNDTAVGMYSDAGDIIITGNVAGNISATAQTSHTAMGIYAKGGTLNGGDAATAVDVSGDITATANGLAVGIAANDAMNLNISGTITATDSSGGTANYAIRSGADDGAGGWVDAAVNDTIQLSTGAVINTRADLAGGTDSLSLDGTGTLSAEFLNTENLYKTGSGTWSLTADQTVDLTEISGGTLAVNGTLTSTDVTVNASGTLSGAGTITGDVVNSGAVAPGNSPGTLTIAGDYTQNSGSTLDIEIAASAQDQLVVTGTTTINGGTLNLIVDEGVLVQDGASYVFIDAQGGYTGSFDDYETNSIFLTLEADDGAATLGGVVSRASYSTVARDSNSEDVAVALDTALPGAGGDFADALSALDLLSASDAATALTQLHPESYSALTESSFSTMRLFAGTARERFSAVNTDTAQLTFQDPGRMLNLVSSGSLTSKGLSSLNMGTRNTPGVSGDHISSNQAGIYFAPVMQWEKYDTVTNRTGFEADTLGFTFGGDYKPAENWLVGLMGGYATTDTAFETPSSSTADSDHAMLGIYAGYKPGNFYINGMVQGGISDNDMTRYIDLSSQTYEAEGDFYSYNFATNLTTGYDFTFQNYTFGPVASLDYGYVYNESFSEIGASGLNLDVESNSANSLKTGLGARIMAMYDFSATARVIPFITAIWSHEFLNDSRTITSSFISSPGSAFSVSTGDPDRDSMLLSVGATLSGAFKADFFIRYNGDLLAGSRQAHAGVLGVQYQF